MLSPIPRRNRGVHISLSSPTMAAFPDFWAGRLPHCVFRGLLSVHSRYGLHTCQVTFMTFYTGGFSRFVTSTTAPIATGWSDFAGRDSHPLRNRAFARRTKIYVRLQRVDVMFSIVYPDSDNECTLPKNGAFSI
jgi:hypothetical protein